ncbi:MAG TPA: hypothetical protein IAA98_14325 [Candidatus Avipropionibacterium avicola]|uniref:DUF2569 domain-containing protein n=1 Tax=Candidatus Avipropionibacterium avicola TaxID=2840701 RepID=A0A9D1H0G3_9ACTN|nr:hypothetical protein [Candidatus Avipropionibacterium avicola]
MAPPTLRWLIPVVIGYGIVLALLPLQMVLWPDGVIESVRRQEPGLDPYWQAMAVRLAIAQAALIHAVSLGLAIWFTVKVLRGRRWARIALTVQMLLSIPESLYSATSGATFVPHVIASNCFHVAILGLLWVPASVRSFFRRPSDRAGAGRTSGSGPDAR